MARHIKLPDSLKAWKVNSLITKNDNCEIYQISKKTSGSVTKAILRYICIKNDEYTDENADFIEDEANFIKDLMLSGDCFNYIDAVAEDKPAKATLELFIITEKSKPLSEVLKNKSFTTEDIVDFGIKMSEILAILEDKNIYHGNIAPQNIFVTENGEYKLGGFSDFEAKIEDFSFVAPEIYNKKNADFTTDIYSLGLIMYYMANNGKLPFESSSINKDEAIKTRIKGTSITAPECNNEKLASIIVIACQPGKGHRWKNAINIKNALMAVQSELTNPVESNEKAEIPVNSDATVSDNENISENSSENTNDNFESFEYKDEPKAELETTDTTVNSEENAEKEDSAEAENDKNEDISDNKDTEIKSDDTSEPTETENATNTDEKPEASNISEPKDYGDYFDDEPEPKANSDKNKSGFNKSGITDVNIFEEEPVIEDKKIKDKNKSKNSKKNKPANTKNKNNKKPDKADEKAKTKNAKQNKKKKNNAKKAVLIIVCIIAILAALGCAGYFAMQGYLNNNPVIETTSPEATTENATVKPSTAPTTVPPTTEPTTAEPTTAENIDVINVVGYGYSYAKELLEEQGFTVVIGQYLYSYYYDEGYVISQTPEGNNSAEKGSVVTLDISLGYVQETTQAPTEVPTEPVEKDDNYILYNSDSVYLTSSDIEDLSRTELNLALNEIYARRGRIFNDADISAYFNSKSWYKPLYNKSEFDAKITFNRFESANLQLMINEQKANGWR